MSADGGNIDATTPEAPPPPSGDGSNTADTTSQQSAVDAGRLLAEQLNEDIFQRLLAIAAKPPTFRNPMRGVSVDILLRMAGKDDSTFSATAPQDATHPSHTLVMVLRRLNEESRHAIVALRDEFEDTMATRRQLHAAAMQTLQDKTKKAIANAVEQHHREMTAAEGGAEGGEVGDQDTAEDTLAMLEREISAIEHKLLNVGAGNDASGDFSARRGSVADAELIKTKRLMTYWKSRYSALVSELEQNEEELGSTTTKLREMHELMKHDPTHLQRVLGELREVETRERLKTESLRARYLQEAKQRNVQPQEPKLISSHASPSSTPRGPGSEGSTPARRGSNASQQAHVIAMVLAASAAGSDEAAASNRSVTGSEIASVISSHRADGSTTIEGGAASGGRPPLRYITELGHRDTKVVTMVKRLQQREEEESELRRSIDDCNSQLAALSKQLDEAQQKYCVSAGKMTGATASIYEEIVSIRAQVDAIDAEKMSAKLAVCDEEVRSAGSMVQLVSETEREEVLALHRREQTRRFLREKELDVLRGSRKRLAGLNVTTQDLSDAPTTDLGLRVHALNSQLEVLDADRQLLRSQVEKAKEATLYSAASIDSRLGLTGTRLGGSIY